MIKRLITLLVNIFKLSKIGISLSVASTTAIGYLLYSRQLDITILSPFFGVLLLSFSASAINQIQEQYTDGLMLRTHRRPLISGAISRPVAIVISAVFLLAGGVILFMGNGALAVSLGVFNLLWYNLVYTPLKYKSAFAAFPGGIVGAIPPVIGWVSAGGEIYHPTAIALATFFFIGQIPHFWLIISRYHKEYRQAGIMSITDKFSDQQLKRLIFTWVLATAMCGALLVLIIGIDHVSVIYVVQILSIMLALFFIKWFMTTETSNNRKPFIYINVYYLLVMIGLLVDIIIIP